MKPLFTVMVAATICLFAWNGFADNMQDLQEGNSAFCFDLYKMLRNKTDNLFFSPYSISTALGMTYAGARGETEREMAAVLHFPADQIAVHASFNGLKSRLVAIQDQGNIQLNAANALWAQLGLPLLASFSDLTKRYYGAEVNFTDFAGNAEEARATINAWVEKETRDKIQDLIKQGMLDPSTMLVLCNAVYFKGDWSVPFEKERTRDAEFFVASGKSVMTSMMNQSLETKFRRFDDFSAIELPYAGNNLSMVVFLPERHDGLDAFEENLNHAAAQVWLDDLANASVSEVAVSLPRFKTTCEFDLSAVLSEMGMSHAFADADFSGMTGQRDLFISKVVHKAFVDVNEEGTEAAAATAVIMDKSFRRPVAFCVDHPFMFLIREKETGSILFAGRITDPTQ